MPYLHQKYPPIFNDLLCLSMNSKGLEASLFEKGKLTLSEISQLRDRFSSSKFAIFASFVPLFKTPDYQGPEKGFKFDEFIFGFVLYEMVSKKILSLSIDPYSQIPSKEPNKIDRDSVSRYGRALLNLFTVIPPYFHCCCPLPIVSQDYAPIPWLIFALLNAKFNGTIRKYRGENELSLSEFFAFGAAPDLSDGLSSFYYDRERQVAFVYLIFRDNGNRLAYELRFDYHSFANLHMDFEIHAIDTDEKVKKILKHEEIDLTEVDQIDPVLLMSILFTGMHDPYFDRIVDQHIVGLDDVIKNNPVLRNFLDYRNRTADDVKFLKNNKKPLTIFLNIEKMHTESSITKMLTKRKLVIKENGRLYRTSYGDYILNWLKREKLV